MKKIIYLILGVLSFVYMVSCSDDDNNPDKEQHVVRIEIHRYDTNQNAKFYAETGIINDENSVQILDSMTIKDFPFVREYRVAKEGNNYIYFSQFFIILGSAGRGDNPYMDVPIWVDGNQINKGNSEFGGGFGEVIHLKQFRQPTLN